MLARAFAHDLFAGSVIQLVEDAEGGVRYWPGFVSGLLAEEWFQSLHDKATWAHMRRPMYDRVVDIPRLLASYPLDCLPPELPLADMLVRIQGRVPAPYNTVGLNLYRDGSDSVAMHNDKLHTLVNGYPIALVSLGDSRRMLIRAKAGTRDTIAVDLEPGSLLCMSYASQITHEHGIPKTKRNQAARISAVFRVRPTV